MASKPKPKKPPPKAPPRRGRAAAKKPPRAKDIGHPKGASSQVAAAHRRRLFAEAWMSNNGNKTQAAISAGFSPRTAHTAGNRLFKHDDVQAIIAARHAKVFDDLEITTERILKERARLAFHDPRRQFDEHGRRIPIHKLDQDTAAAIAGIDIGKDGIKIRWADKNASLTALEKQRGMYKADNEQNNPPAPDIGEVDPIQAARAIAFVLAEAAHVVSKRNKGTKTR